MLHSVSIILSSGIVIFEKMWATDVSNKVRYFFLFFSNFFFFHPFSPCSVAHVWLAVEHDARIFKADDANVGHIH